MRKFVWVAVLFAMVGFKKDKLAFQVFTGMGKLSRYEKLLKEAAKADVVFFGELHDNPICHWLELQITKDLYDLKKDKLILGAEMFEADNQQVLNTYLAGGLKDKEFAEKARLWPNYKTDYKPLVLFAHANKLHFIAANIPRKYATMVYKYGLTALDTIPSEARAWMTPLPFPYDPELPCYKEIYASAGGHGGDNLPKSQAIKDATMAHFILKNWVPGKQFLHYNGAYHSNNHEGIIWYLHKEKPDLKVFTIGSELQDTVTLFKKESMKTADFIIYIPSDMTRTY